MPNKLGEMTFEEVVSELQLANPKANITVNMMSDGPVGIVSNCSAVKLALPRDFYVTRAGSISNYGNTESGNYLSINVAVRNTELNQTKLSKLKFFDKIKCKLFARKTQVSVDEEHSRKM